MKPLVVGEIRELVNGVLIQGSDDILIKNVAYYLKKIKRPNMLLFLRSNRNVNWDIIHSCVPCAVIMDKNFSDLQGIDGCTAILVEDIQIAYWQFVEYYRRLFQIPVVAVTGTCGKTTTKDMIHHILNDKFKVHGTNASANGRTGHLSNLMGIDETTQAAVFETAVGKPGDITNSSKYFKPTIGIITNIGLDHLDGCKTVDGYIRAKGEMVSILGEGVLIVNADDEKTKTIGLDNFEGRIVCFGIHNPSDFQATKVNYSINGMEFVLSFENTDYPIFVPGYGEHQVYNALAACAAVHEMGMGIGMNEATERLQTFDNMLRHLEMLPGTGGSIIIDDTWKISLNSLESALNVLQEMGKKRKKIALLGSIPSLGNLHEEVYRNAGEIIARTKVDVLLSVGKMAGNMVKEMAKYAEKRGWSGEVCLLKEYDDAYRLLKKTLDEHCILLIKGDMYDQSMIHLVTRLRY
jgi:UDP-N-acetylmuramoyl-tripeptide--D-alanyl-D-alanine ligase